MAPTSPSLSTIREVRDSCLCLASQRAARRLARRFDRAFQPAGLTNNQFSALMFIAAAGQTPGRLADLMAMDRTTVTALLKALEHAALIESSPDEDDRRIRRVAITEAGRARLEAALPIWRAEHARLDQEIARAVGAISRSRLPPQPRGLETAATDDDLAAGRALLAALADAPLTSPPPAPP